MCQLKRLSPYRFWPSCVAVTPMVPSKNGKWLQVINALTCFQLHVRNTENVNLSFDFGRGRFELR